MLDPRSGTRAPNRSDSPHVLHLAVVTSIDGVLMATAACELKRVLSQIVDYVRQNSRFKLSPELAREVEQMIKESRYEEAVEIYFSRVGERWDPERLHRDAIENE